MILLTNKLFSLVKGFDPGVKLLENDNDNDNDNNNDNRELKIQTFSG